MWVYAWPRKTGVPQASGDAPCSEEMSPASISWQAIAFSFVSERCFTSGAYISFKPLPQLFRNNYNNFATEK